MKENILSFFKEKSLNMDEAKKIAIALERQGFRFYMGMKDRIPGERTRSVFTQMAHEERKHVSDIEALLKDPGSEWYLDPSSEEMVQQYFDEYMKDGIFPSGPDAEEAVLELKDEVRAVELALNFEKDAVEFYKELVRTAKDGGTKKAFEELVEFEKGHVQTLDMLLKALKA